MTDPFLFAVVMGVFGLTCWLAATSNVTPAERDEMLKDEEMWP